MLTLGIEIPGGTNYDRLTYTVLDAGGNTLTSLVPAYNSTTGQVTATIPTSGIYRVRVTDYDDYEGEYRLRVILANPTLLTSEVEGNDTVATATPVTLTTSGNSLVASVTGYTSTNNDLDYFNLGTIQAGQSIFLTTSKPSYSGIDPTVSVYNASNAYIPEAGSGRPFDGVAQVDITTTGVYYAVIHANNLTGALLSQYIMNIQVVTTGSLVFPNLQVTTVTPPTGTLQSGQSTTLTYTVTNVGNQPTQVPNWYDEAVLSTDKIFGNADDIPIASFAHTGVLAPGQSYTVTPTVTLPDGISGDYYLILFTDSTNVVNEGPLEGDNTTVSPSTFHINLAPYPDLRVQNLAATGPDASDTFHVTWNTANTGNGPVTGNWHEKIVVTSVATSTVVFSSEPSVTGPLAAGANLARSIDIPNLAPGLYNLSVTTDSQNEVYEFDASGHADAEGNNVSTLSNLADALDLQVGSISFQPNSGLKSGGGLTVNWTDANAGNRATTGAWTDHVTVVNNSTGQTLFTTDVPYDPTQSGNGAIAGGDSRNRSTSFTLPDGAAGVGSLVATITVDSTNTISEYNTAGNAETNNTSTAMTTSTLAAYADLQVTGLALTPSSGIQSGNSLTATWMDKNQGNAAVNAAFNDYVLIQKVVGSNFTTIASGFVAGNATLGAGSTSATQSFPFTLPDGSSGTGDIRVTVTTDYGQTVKEYDASGNLAYTNNSSSTDVTSTLANYADLIVTTGSLAVTPASPQSGGALTATWKDTNQGTGAVNGTFNDYVLVQRVVGSNFTTIASGFVAGNSLLGAGATGVVESFPFTLPDGSGGTGDIRVTVTTDYGQTVKEYDASGNLAYTNNTSSTDVTSSLANYADLIVAAGSLAVTPSSPQSGGSVTATWTDKNQGTGAVNSAFSDYVLVQRVVGTTFTYITSGYVAGNASLGVGATSGTQSFPFTLPNGTTGTGDIRVTVTTDVNQTVKEYDASGNTAYGNNTSSIDVNSTLATYADLVVTTGSLAVTPASPQSGGVLSATWTDKNQGNGAVNAAFSDYVLVQRVVGSNFTYITSGYVAGNATLAAGSTSATQSFPFTLPDGSGGTGDIRVTVTTDSGQTVKEYDASGNPAYGNNTSSTDATSSLANYADLIVAAGSLAVTPSSPQSGGSVTATWTDKNQGTGAVNSAFSDYVLVQRVVGTTFTYITSGYVAGNASLGVGATSGTQSFPFTLPNGTTGTGDIRVTVTTDVNQTVKEYDASGNTAYGNNTSSTDATSTLAPSPDLVVQAIVVNGGVVNPILPGQTVAVTWNDVNQGSAAANGSWLDQVFLSSDAAGTQNLQLLQTVNVSTNLAPAGSAPQSATITIPATDVGNKYVVVETGLSESFFEFNTTNDSSVSTAITIPPSVKVSLAAPGNSTFNKNTVNPATTATVTRNDTSVGALSVTITSVNPAAVLLAANPGDTPAASISVVIPNGAFSAVFYVDAVQDGLVDGNQTSALNPTASGYLSIPATATEVETNNPTLSLTLAPGTFTQGSGTTATLTRNTNSANPLDTALTVAIASSDPTVATAPSTVTFMPGQSSVSFPITAVATDLLVATRTVTFTTNSPVDPVTGRPFAATAANATVTDANTPTLVLVTDAPSVEENAANPASYATLTLTDGHGNPFPLASAITVSLASNDAADLTLPSSVFVPAGTTSVRVPLTAINNPNNANPVVTLTAYALDAVTKAPIVLGHAITTITVLDTNGPSLSIAGPPFISVATGQAMATITRGNTPTTSALVVTLTSSNTGEATVPSTVTIAAGATSATFAIQVAGGATAGPVTISAAAAGVNSASLTTTIVTASLADLTVTTITTPFSPQAGQSGVPVSWTVANDGNVTTTGSWSDHVVLSTDSAGNNVVFSTFVPYNGGPLAAGAFYTGSTNINLPHQVGSYYLTVTTATGSSAPMQLTTTNDSSEVGVYVGAAYYATLQVQANEKTVPAGSPLTVSGRLSDVNMITHPPAGILYIAVYRDGMPLEQDGPIFADSQGFYSYTFAPSASHYLTAGDYQFYGLTNGLTAAQVPVQSTDTASVEGFTITPAPISMNLVPGTPLVGTVTLTNLSSVPLTNLVVTHVDEGTGSQMLPITVGFAITNPAQLPGTSTTTPGTRTATYTLTATQSIALRGNIFVTVSDDQGVPFVLELDPTITPPTPRLTATSLTGGVVVGTQTLASFTLTNSGSASTGAITIVSPVSWITPSSMPTPLAPGQSEQVQVILSPAENQQLGLVNGNLGADYAGTGVAVPFSFDVTSDQHGSVQVIVDDESTTATETGGHYAGALVQLIDPLTSLPIATATTTSAGITFGSITAGTYELEVTAPKHSTYTSPIIVQPGPNTSDVFIHQQMVTYTWTVVPTTIPDHYTIQLQADFTTQVPIPNLVPDKPFVMPLLGEGGSVMFVENVTNEGLIEATNVTDHGRQQRHVHAHAAGHVDRRPAGAERVRHPRRW